MVLRKRSVKRAKQEREYGKLRDKFLQDRSYCEAKIMCDGVIASDIHHIRGRAMQMLNNQSEWMPVCRKCHNWIHENDAKARELGLLKSRLSNG